MGFLFFLQGPNFSIKKEDSVGGKGFWRKDTKETKTNASTTTTTTRIERERDFYFILIIERRIFGIKI